MTEHEQNLSAQEKAVYGHDAKRDPVSGRVFEQGRGALPREIQAQNFLRERGGEISEARPL